MSDTLTHAAETVAAIRADGFAFGYGAGRSTLKQMVTKSNCPLTDAQWAVVDEITEFAGSRCIAWAPVVADAIESNPTEYHQIHARLDDRVHDGLSYTDHIFSLCVLNDEQAWYSWSRKISGHLPTDSHLHRTRYCSTEAKCQLIDATEDQKAQCREFYESSEIIRRPRRSGQGFRSIRKYAVDKLGACQRILTVEQRDQWNRIKTAGPLPTEWNRLRSDRAAPELPADPITVTPDRRRLADLRQFFSQLEKQCAEITPIQAQSLSRLEAIVQNAIGWLQFRNQCPLTVRREDPKEWATRELVRYAEQIAKFLILTEDQERLLHHTESSA